jgi:cellulose synthase/poly-beta-1,6-N-acetylglucosamine synthase-like glycosyltransferase
MMFYDALLFLPALLLLPYFLLLILLIWHVFYFRRPDESSDQANCLSDAGSEVHATNGNLPMISVVVAARNEKTAITACLDSILACGYPETHFEVLVVDDHSTDGMSALINQHYSGRVRLLALPDDQQGKKAAIAFGVMHAIHAVVATTDADSVVPAGWLHSICQAINQPETDMVTGPVLPIGGSTALHAFQRMDLAVTMVLTMAGIRNHWWSLANGANMAFKKSFFTDTGGFRSHLHIPSGDDLFLASAAAVRGYRHLVFAAWMPPVITKSEETWRALWLQRRRWASKSFAVAQPNLVFVQSIIFVANMSCLISLISLCMVSETNLAILIVPVISKMMADFILLLVLSRRTGWKLGLRWFFPVFFVYPIYFLLSGIAAFGNAGFEWKDRKWKKAVL